jgi:hypothetical protein
MFAISQEGNIYFRFNAFLIWILIQHLNKITCGKYLFVFDKLNTIFSDVQFINISVLFSEFSFKKTSRNTKTIS